MNEDVGKQGVDDELDSGTESRDRPILDRVSNELVHESVRPSSNTLFVSPQLKQDSDYGRYVYDGGVVPV